MSAFEYTDFQSLVETVLGKKVNTQIACTDSYVSGPPESITYDEDLETVTLHFEAPIKEGRFVLSLEFKGHLNDNMEGFYRSTAKTEAGKEQIILSTDFEGGFRWRQCKAKNSVEGMPTIRSKTGIVTAVDLNLHIHSHDRQPWDMDGASCTEIAEMSLFLEVLPSKSRLLNIGV
ncbi:hypothetical protein SprV_0902725600 [Sparganum proliferum]